MSLPEYERLAARGHRQQVRSTSVPIIDEGSASIEVQHLYERFRQDFGRPQVPGILQCFATHPPLLEHMMGLAKEMLFVDGALGRQNKELISAFVSAMNSCAYCADSHAYSFRVQGGTAGATEAVLACTLDSEAISLKQRSLLQFVKKITENSSAILREDIDAMHLEGWNDLQIAEAIHVTALFAAFNRVVNAFGLPSQDLLSAFEEEAPNAR